MSVKFLLLFCPSSHKLKDLSRRFTLLKWTLKFASTDCHHVWLAFGAKILVVARAECIDLPPASALALASLPHSQALCLPERRLRFHQIPLWTPVSNVCGFREASTSLSCKRKAEPQQKCFVWCKNLHCINSFSLDSTWPPISSISTAPGQTLHHLQNPPPHL